MLSAVTDDWAGLVARRSVPVAAVIAMALTAVVWRLGLRPDLSAFCYLAVTSVVLAFVDVALGRLPDGLTLPSYPVATGLLGFAVPFTTDGGEGYVHALAGMAGLFALYGLPWLVVPNHIGLGDVKLSGVLGLYLGWLGLTVWIAGAFFGFLFNGLCAAGLLATRRATRKSSLPFGPLMMSGAFVAIFLYG